MSWSSGFWKKNGDREIFGGSRKRKGLWSSGQDTPGASPMEMDGGMEWEELEKEYNKDFESRADHNEPPFSRYYPYGQKEKYEPQFPEETQTETTSHPGSFRDIENKDSEDQKTAVDNSTGQNPYREEEMKITNVRRGGHKKLTNIMSNRFSNRSPFHLRGGSKPPPETNPVDCPESGCQVGFRTCCECNQFQVWHEKDDGMKRCYHEYKKMKDKGEYENMVTAPPSEEDQENFDKTVEKERLRLEKKGPSKDLQEARQATNDFFKFMWGDSDGGYEKNETADSGDDHGHDYYSDYDDEEEGF
jgi:hypothetical protein